MTRNDIAVAIWEAGHGTKEAADAMTKAVFQNVVDALTKGEDVSITGLGTFKCKVREARKGRNPRTGETLNLPAMTVVRFKLSDTIDLKKPGKRK
jgi:DNA-binding protein HU-beta